MKTQTRLKGAVAPIALSVMLAAQPVFAQDTPAEPAAAAAAEDEGEVILVTGTRIASPTIDSVSPVQVVDAEAIDRSGAVNVQELLLENPVFGVPALSRTNSNFLTSGTGVATVDLRDLGSDRTLVMVNSRRVVAGLPGSSTVDLNVIPTQFIERVDILTGGVSSLYGSDAVAGVVNFIYKRDFEGLEAEALYGVTEHGDAPRYQANLTWGGNFADDRGNIMLHVGYSHEGALRSAQRANTAVDDGDLLFTAFTGDPADYGVVIEPFYSSFAPQGRYDVFGTPGVGDDFTFSPTGALETSFSTNGPDLDGDGLGDGGPLARGFNRQAYRYLAVPVTRYLFAGQGHYDLTDTITVFGEATYANTRASRQLEPYALETGGTTPLYPGTGRMPIETRVPVEGTNTFTIVRNPFVPDAIYAAATDIDGDGLRDVAFARRLTDFGPRAGETTRDFYRFVLGLEGEVLDNFRWDLSYNFGRTAETQNGSGQPNFPNLRQALAVIPGADGPVCADPAARQSGCVPVNIFGANTITAEALPFISAEQQLTTRITQQTIAGNITGDLIELPAGPLGIALGGEYRKESSIEDNDGLTNAGLNGSNALPDTSGSFDVVEAYAEINVPILSERPFFEQLNLRAAARVSDYSTVGTIYTYNAGVEWAPVQNVRLSGTYARAVRAPNIGELFTGPSQTFPSGIVDPCEGVTATDTGTTAEVCRADPGVALNIAQNGAFTITQADRQGISGFDSGNPNLREEKSDSYTASLVIEPDWFNALRNAVVRVDYYNITIDDAIVNLPRTTILDECYNRNNPDFCQFVIRYPTALGSSSAGAIQYINSGGVNAGQLKAEGIDVTVSNRFDLDAFGMPGSIDTRVAYSHIFQNYLIPLEGADKDVTAGEIGTPKDRFTAFLGYSNDLIDWGFTGTFLGRSCEDDASLIGFFDLPACSVKVGSEFYLDTQVRLKLEPAEIFVGVDNLLDNDAPRILTNTPFNTTGTDTAADVYDVFGRRIYAGARFRF